MNREPFSFASALKETMELCWPRSQGAEKPEQISANTGASEPKAGTSAIDSDTPCEECGHAIWEHGAAECAEPVLEESGYVACGCTAWESDEEETLTPREEAENELRETREFNSIG